MCCYILMKGAWLSLPGSLITSAHVTPFNKPQSPPFSPLLSKIGGQRAEECRFACVSMCPRVRQLVGENGKVCVGKREKRREKVIRRKSQVQHFVRT